MKTIPFKVFPGTICAQHGIIGVLPCPWPDCANGIADESFQEETFLKNENAYNIYHRHQWKSPIEGTYYTWKDETLPNWHYAAQTLWNEARRLGLVQKNNVKTIYHYTSLDALVGIVEAQSVWLSDYSYLNDKRELVYGVEIVSEVVKELLQSGQSKDVQSLLNAWLEATSNGRPQVCIAAFSSDSDSLSQWRAYGPIAIGFTPQLIAIHTNQARLGSVEYDPKIQRQLVEVLINHLVQAYQVDLANKELERNNDDVYHKFEQVLELVAFFKHSSFRDEREFRLAYVEHPQLFNKGYIKPPPKRFRIKGNRLLPYIVSSELFPDSNGQRRELGICEIILGPEVD
ncbi:MAG: DUF2971 domain-containing protein, partial [Smithella sp.]|nr:DUF2971 domain-containing protein [Smithella sp.]